MLRNMLIAVSKMIEGVPDKTAVQCAKVIIDQVIKELEPKVPMTSYGLPDVPIVPVLDNKKEAPEPKSVPKSGEYRIVVDKGLLSRIDNLPMDAEIEVDGKITTHREAIGKKFSKGRII